MAWGTRKIKTRRKELSSELLAFVPLGHNAEIHRVSLTNHSDKIRRFKLFSYAEFCLWNAQDDMTNFQRNLSIGEVEVEGSTIYHTTEYRERPQPTTPFIMSINPLPGLIPNVPNSLAIITVCTNRLLLPRASRVTRWLAAGRLSLRIA